MSTTQHPTRWLGLYCYFTAGPRMHWRKDVLHIVAADGSGDTPLTGAYTFAHPLGWCPEE